jgi:glycosyltransferase involved in cell wall biosynthesis
MSSLHSPRPGVSVVIPAHDAEVWLPQTLQSVLEQHHASDLLDLLVIDDGSHDGTPAAAERALREAPFRWEVLSIENGGPSRARNLGWQRAGGEWIQFLDADDLLAPEKLAHQAATLAGAPDDVAVVYSPWQRMALTNGAWAGSGPVMTPRIRAGHEVADLLAAENFIQLGAALFRRSWLGRVGGFDETRWVIEDVDLCLRLAMAGGRFHAVSHSGPLLFYRQLPGMSLSNRDAEAFIRGCLANASAAEAYWRSLGTLTSSEVDALVPVYFQAARYFASRDQREFRALTDKIEELRPHFVPPYPAKLRWFARLLGYRRAETLATAYRAMKDRLRPSVGARP